MTPNGYNTAIRALFDAWELRPDRTAAVPIDHTQWSTRRSGPHSRSARSIC